MSIETVLREAMNDLADETAAVPGLAATAMRRARRRRTAVRSAVAVGAAIAVAVPVGVTVLGRDGRSAVAVADRAGSDILPAPEVRELTGDELAAAYDACYARPPESSTIERWEPVHGVQVVDPPSDTAPVTWVVGRSGDQRRVECALTAAGDVVPSIAMIIGVDEFPHLVDARGGIGAGQYADPVARVTVQFGDELEQDAVLWRGFWFYPMDRTRVIGESGSCAIVDGDEARRSLLTGIPLRYAIRGYDADGRLVYDSSTVDEDSAGDAGTDLAREIFPDTTMSCGPLP